MIVKRTVVAMLGGGGGSGVTTPIVGTSPAKVGILRATIKAAAIASRFISDLQLGFAKLFTSAATKAKAKNPCKESPWRTTIPLAVHFFLPSTRKVFVSNEGNSG